jgi:peptidoglycan/LPS O-acetylase OafA/YrhL
MSQSHLKPLTGLRFLAALLVVLGHGTAFWLPTIGQASSTPGLARLLALAISGIAAKGGGVAVTLFFVLSGFILAYTYCPPDGGLRGGRRAFYVARVARIYPVYLFGFVAIAVPYLGWSSATISPRADNGLVASGLAQVTLTQAWFPFLAASWNGPAWSVSTEAFFYLLFPLAATATARLTRQHLIIMLEVLWAIDLAVPFAFLALHPTGVQEVYWLRVVYYNPLARLPTFLIGVALGRLFTLASRTQGQGTTQAKKRLRASHVGAATLVVITGILATVPWVFGPLYDVALTPLLAVLIYALAWSEGRLAAFFALPAMVALGEASYALYILHVPLWQWVAHAGAARVATYPMRVVFYVAYLGLLVAISLLSLRFLEQPARRAIRQALLPSRISR